MYAIRSYYARRAPPCARPGRARGWRPRSRWLVLVFVMLAAAGVFMLWLPGVSLIITFAGLFAVLVACAFLTPSLTQGVMAAATPIGGRFFV